MALNGVLIHFVGQVCRTKVLEEVNDCFNFISLYTVSSELRVMEYEAHNIHRPILKSTPACSAIKNFWTTDNHET